MEIEINTKVELADELAEVLLAHGENQVHGHTVNEPLMRGLVDAGMYEVHESENHLRAILTEKGRMVLLALRGKTKPLIEHLYCYGVRAVPDAKGGVRLSQAAALRLKEVLEDLQERQQKPPSRTPTREAPRVQPGNPVQPHKPLNYGHKAGEYPYAVGSCSVCENRTDYSRGGDGPNCPGCGRS